MDWDSTLEVIARKIAIKHRVKEFYVKDIVEHCLKSTKHKLRTPEMPAVRWPKFGTFRVRLGTVNRRLRIYIRRYRKGVITKEKLKFLLETYFPVRRRIRNEHFKRKPSRRYPGYRERNQIVSENGTTSKAEEN